MGLFLAGPLLMLSFCGMLCCLINSPFPCGLVPFLLPGQVRVC